jgi:hypothetical protein
VTPLTGFLAGFVVPFNATKAATVTGDYRVEIDGRRFEFAVNQGELAAARRQPDVTVTASAADLVTARLGSTEAKRKAALRRVVFDGEADAVGDLRQAFSL